jgi:hypothetical protein
MFVLDLYAVQLTKDIFATFIVSHIKSVCLIRHLKCFTLYPVFERCCVGEDQTMNCSAVAVLQVGCLFSQ